MRLRAFSKIAVQPSYSKTARSPKRNSVKAPRVRTINRF
ncbi:hypothetical protein PhaeoP18_00714 [Phaeobacter piscinae]|nr:hypothetical protein PhaeoP71_02312 [Phaeobacter piscinae]AUR35007.1 hypothetical protein PhaeoP18_00714 [Phaeobacter piscinae]